ncbi:hypothetical protein [Corynebacterium timonense]|uniref:Transposase n=1 Tax=Corynebacterium timonense TaxID=441500 RepID=A0A1H1LR45_9CORY|nr:hypothetical protein [Corynebacterium timonense]SDR77021.1 hypothetical protein SAMN04488539_0308 [Corynebacterium timonense]
MNRRWKVTGRRYQYGWSWIVYRPHDPLRTMQVFTDHKEALTYAARHAQGDPK